jgi:SNF2 family DNA or RNA helicase
MICRDTIEEKIIEIQNRKKKVSNELINTEDGFTKSLDLSDVEYLFS